MTFTAIEDRFRTLGPYPQDELLRDLKTLVAEVNSRLVDLQPVAAPVYPDDLDDELEIIDANEYDLEQAIAVQGVALYASALAQYNAQTAALNAAIATLTAQINAQIVAVYTRMADDGDELEESLDEDGWTLEQYKLHGLDRGSYKAGDLAYHDGTQFNRLAKGSAGQVLKMNVGLTAPYWDSSCYVNEANWSGAAWQTALNGRQGIANTYDAIRNMAFTGAIGIGLVGIQATVAGLYKFYYRFYVAGGQAGRIAVEKNQSTTLAFVQFNVGGDSTVVMEGQAVMAVGDYFNAYWSQATNCYHASLHTAFSCFLAAPP